MSTRMGGARLRRAGDPRVIGGVLVMAVSAYLGVLLSTGGPEASLVAVAVRDLPAGVELQADDFALREVVLAEPQRYLSTDVSGSLSSPVGRGELIPRSAIADGPSPLRLVAVPVAAERLPPDISRGSRIDVWSVGETPVLQGVAVAGVTDPKQWSGATATVVLAVAQAEVAELLAATRGGSVDVAAHLGQG